jgi:hypothetical protein
MENAARRQFIANLPSEARTIFHAGFGVVTGRSSDLQACPTIESALLLAHLPGFGENQWCLGVRSCLPLRGSPGFAPGSL